MLDLEVVRAIEAHFEAVWVLSLRRSRARHERLRQALSPLKYRMVWAEDGMTYDLQKMHDRQLCDLEAARAYTTKGRKLQACEVACAMSHRKIYEAIIKRNVKNVLVLEDDVAPCVGTVSHLGAALASLPHDWELCYLGYGANETYTLADQLKQGFYRLKQRFGLLHKVKYKVGRKRYPTPYNAHLMRPGFHYGAHAYAVSQSACRKLCDAQTPIVFEADRLLTDLIYHDHLNAFALRQKIFTNLSVEGAVPSLLAHSLC